MSLSKELLPDSYSLPLLDPEIVMGHRSLERLGPTRLIRLGQQIRDRTAPDERARRIEVEEASLSTDLDEFSESWETYLKEHNKSSLDGIKGIFEVDATGLDIKFGGVWIDTRRPGIPGGYKENIWDFSVRSPYGPGLDIQVSGDTRYPEGSETPVPRLVYLKFADPSERIPAEFTSYPFPEQLNGFTTMHKILDAIREAKQQEIIEFR